MKQAAELLVQERAVVPHQPTVLETVLRAIAQPGMTVEVAREYLEMAKELEAIDAKRQFTMAMATLKPKLPVIAKNGLIVYKPGSKPTKFSKWDDIHRACMPLLSEHGFTISFSSELQGGNALVVTMTVRHTAGHEDKGSLVVPWLDTGGSKSPAQAAASSFTLAQRHVFVKYFDVLTEDADDDGSGKGIPDKVTQEQVMQMEDLLHELENRQAGFTGRFNKWLKLELKADSVIQLFQGEQFNSAVQKLGEKLKELGGK